MGKIDLRATRRLFRLSLGVVQLLLCLFIIALLLISVVAAVRADEIPGHSRLFLESESKMRSSVGRFEKRVRKMEKESFALLADGQLESILIPVSDEDVLFHKTSFKSGKRTSTWIGQDSNGEKSILLTLGDDHLFARVTTPQGTFLYKPDTEPFTAVSYEENKEYEIPLVDDAVPVPALSSPSVSEPSAAADDGSRIDMMVAYTNGIAAVYPGSQIDTRIQYFIDVANLSFHNSSINTRFNLVHSQEYAYTDDSPGDMNEALESFTDNIGIFAGVETVRKRYGADQVTLLRHFVDEGCGLAWVVTEDNADYAYAVVHDGVRSDGYYCSEYTYVHEVGHNLGCAHDRSNASVSGRFDYSYGFQNPGQEFRTVMAYSCDGGNCPRIAYFSNPDILYNGKPTGVVSTDPLAADNALTITQTRVGMAGYMAEVDAPSPVVNPPPLSSIMPLPAIKMILDSP